MSDYSLYEFQGETTNQSAQTSTKTGGQLFDFVGKGKDIFSADNKAYFILLAGLVAAAIILTKKRRK